MSFSIKQVRYFVAAADSGQLSRAAIELNVSQSAVTTAIRQLETVVGITLLTRSSTGVTLTTDGEQFLRHARDILGTVDQAMHMQRRSRRELTGRVRVGLTYTVAGYFLAPLLARFRRVYPDITIALEEKPRLYVERAVVDGAYDLALTMTQDSRDIPHEQHIIHKTLHRSSRRLWVAANHPLLAAETVGFKEIARMPYIALTIDGAWEFAQRYWDALPHYPNVVFKTSSVEAVRTMVGSGMGVSILSDMIYRPWSLEGQRIETRDIDGSVPTVDVSIISPADRKVTAAAQIFMTFLQRGSNAPAFS
jgi:DNA-binding transcriptional LysR family regulator